MKVRRGLGPEVNNDVEEGTTAAAHNFGLGHWRKLKMHPANRALPFVVGDTGLRDRCLEAVRGKFALTECAGEKPAAVIVTFHVDDERPFESGFGKDHRRRFPCGQSNDGSLRYE